MENSAGIIHVLRNLLTLHCLQKPKADNDVKADLKLHFHIMIS